MIRPAGTLGVVLALILATARASAQPGEATPRWYLQTDVAATHWSETDDHSNRFRLINLERWLDGGWLVGAASFRNSFRQPSQIVYGGKVWRPLASLPGVHVKLVGGLVHGYKGEYRDKIPFNGSGVAPAVLVAAGYSTRRFGAEVVFVGTQAVALTAGVFF